MAVNLNPPSSIQAVRGLKLGAVDAGIRKSQGEDLVLLEVSAKANIAGVFTRNKARAAPVEIAVRHLQHAKAALPGSVRALVINSGNANAGLGKQGIEDCLAVCDLVAEQMEIKRESVIPFSTGVIGERLPVEKFRTNLSQCVESLDEDNWLPSARAIMTTDTVPKTATKTVQLPSGEQFTVSGIAKGSGMIEPNMATMLAFIATDANVSHDYLSSILEETVSNSFNSITIDGDTSTNDACMLIATGESAVEIGEDSDMLAEILFAEAVQDVAMQLAQAIVRDGEGATKFVTIKVSGLDSIQDLKRVAKAVGNSPLVKTAFHASDPNWGRIYAAIGNSVSDDVELDRVNIWINDIQVMSDGALSPSYREDKASAAMQNAEFSIDIDLGMTDSGVSATVWTTDFSYEYVRINADYRT